MANQYIIDNRGFITASKLKYFIVYGPQAFYYKYVLEIPLPGDEKTHFTKGTAYDFWVSYGDEAYFDAYVMDRDNLKKDQLIDAILQQEVPEKDRESIRRTLEGQKKSRLQQIYFREKKRLTKAVSRDIEGMKKEARRTKIFELRSKDYDPQHVIETTYKGMKIRGTLDRLSLDRKLIRDTKTSGRIDHFEYDMMTTFDYITSMAFYYILVYAKHDVKCDVVLDVFGSSDPYQYFGYKISRAMMNDRINEIIIPALDAIQECFRTDIWESVYPITYHTQNRYGDIIVHEKGDKIKRTKLMSSGYYHELEGAICNSFVEPLY